MTFSVYLRGLLDEYANEGLSEYYIDQHLTDNTPLESFIDSWISGNEHRPVALLADYGTGKSSAALHLSSWYAHRILSGENGRVPILICLSDISNQQDLEGLLGKLFTNRVVVPGYSFPSFMEFNRNGRFVIFLDGFDEMKHAMTQDDLLWNISEIGRLVVPNSRVLLLGRPTVFLSKAEEDRILHGVTVRGRDVFRHDDAPDFQRVDLRGFTRDEARQFFEMYLAFQERKAAQQEGRAINMDLVQDRLVEINSADIDHLIGKPVHSRMLAGNR